MTAFPNVLVPWTDRAGRFSALRAATFGLVAAPVLLLGLSGWQGNLGPRPLTAAIHDSGDWAVRFLLLALFVSPLRAALRANALIGIRRMLGLAALAYALLHVILYIADQKWDLWKVGNEIVLRGYLTVGFVAVLGLLILGSTSTDSLVRRLGAEAWARLHRLIYPLALLAFVHFFWQRKLEIYEPVLTAGLLLWLLGWRLLRRLELTTDRIAILALAIAAGASTMLLEASYLALRNGLPFQRILEANLDFAYIIRPGWWVLAAGLVFAALAALLRPVPPRRPAASAPPSSAGRSIAATTDGP